MKNFDILNFKLIFFKGFCMDGEIIYSVVGVLLFLIIAYFTLRSEKSQDIQSKEEKRYAIINGYKKELQDALSPLKDDREARVVKKSELLKRFSNELSLNIFFDKSEIREIILDLSVDS